jgi:hypothetical protein
VIHIQPWAWITLLLMGAWHGINPAMGWLFAVALGLQKQGGRAVWRALIPIAIGHLLSVGAIVAIAILAGDALALHHAAKLVVEMRARMSRACPMRAISASI